MSSTIRIVVLITILVGLFISCSTQQPVSNKYESYLDRAETVWKFQGSYLVAKGDSILARGSRGIADISENRYNAPATKFLIGSLTKSFTAIAILQLVEQGHLDLSQFVSTYISDYPEKTGNLITVHNLLCHKSGIPDLSTKPEFFKRINEEISPEEIIQYFMYDTLNFTPGSQYEYSSSNYVLLGMIIEKISGLSYNDYIRENICQPANMENTDVYNDYFQRFDFARGYASDKTGSMREAMVVHPSIGFAAGSIASTVDDLYQLNLALYDTTLLNKESINRMHTSHSQYYGYGWLLNNINGHHLVSHGGSAPGYKSMMQRWPDDSVCVIVLSNNISVPTHKIADALSAIAMDREYELPNTN